MLRLFLAIFLTVTTHNALSVGTVYVRTVDNMLRTSTCDLPTAREDGTPLTVVEIDRLELYVVRDLTDPLPPASFVDSGLACTGQLDMTVLGDGQWYMYWLTYDTAGRVSAQSANVPFVLQSDTGSPPGAVTNVQLQ